jgi:hypothetical protein
VRELLAHSIDGRRIDLITMTSYRGLLESREEMLPLLFPISNPSRPFKSKKPTIFISARVHPGEVPSSFVMNGILDFLSNVDDPQA